MKTRSPRNKTLSCTPEEQSEYREQLIRVDSPATPADITNYISNQDMTEVVPLLPPQFVDLLILDPPYNLAKNYNGRAFGKSDPEEYQAWFARVVDLLEPTLKPDATIYVCADWRTSMLVGPVLDERFKVRNRITWEREKGRGSKTNWKNNTEDIWFCTKSDSYTFDVETVKLRRRVVAPYTDQNGTPKDWTKSKDGNFRMTHPSNIWTDLTVPFWSMPENTDHPTQKPEKLIAKLILASSEPNDFVLDPFLGSGTTAAVCKKLDRRFFGIELDEEYCCWAQKRVAQAAANSRIQGYVDGVFWERNSGPAKQATESLKPEAAMSLFNE